MGRPPAPHLKVAQDMLANGEWRLRDEVLAEMVKTVPPGMAHRRGVAISHGGARSDEEYIRRGARHICIVSLNVDRFRQRTHDGLVFIRLQQLQGDPPRPVVLYAVPDGEASHVLVPVTVWRGEERLDLDELQWLRFGVEK